jgi:hypothetical protein
MAPVDSCQKIHSELKDSSKEIYKEKHDGKEMPSKPASPTTPASNE